VDSVGAVTAWHSGWVVVKCEIKNQDASLQVMCEMRVERVMRLARGCFVLLSEGGVVVRGERRDVRVLGVAWRAHRGDSSAGPGRNEALDRKLPPE